MENIYGCGISEYDAADGEGLTLCLGFFDCVHNGHKRVIDAAAELAAKLGLSDSEYELEGIMAKLSGNNDKRTLAVNVRREWNKDKGWEYTVAAR